MMTKVLDYGYDIQNPVTLLRLRSDPGGKGNDHPYFPDYWLKDITIIHLRGGRILKKKNFDKKKSIN